MELNISTFFPSVPKTNIDPRPLGGCFSQSFTRHGSSWELRSEER